MMILDIAMGALISFLVYLVFHMVVSIESDKALEYQQIEIDTLLEYCQGMADKCEEIDEELEKIVNRIKKNENDCVYHYDDLR